MLIPQTITQRKLIYLKANEPNIKVDFSSDVAFKSLYAVGFQLLYECREERIKEYSPILDLRIKGVERIKNVPVSLFDLSRGFDHSLPVAVDTQTEQAALELTLRYHELFPKVKDVNETEKNRLKAAPFNLTDEQPAGNITLELLIFGYSSLA